MTQIRDYDIIQLRVLNTGGELSVSIHGQSPPDATAVSKLTGFFTNHQLEFGWSLSILAWEWSGVIWSQVTK